MLISKLIGRGASHNDTCIDDVRKKVGYDHSYALSLRSLKSWIMMDISIITKTLIVMVDGRGR